MYETKADVALSIARYAAGIKSDIDNLLRAKTIDWTALKDLIAYHELAPFAYLVLKNFDQLVPQETYKLLKNSYYCSLVQCQRFWQEFRRILTAFERAQIVVLPIKGIALIEDLYVQYPVRPMVDIDLLIQEKNIQQAEAIFRDLGYKKELRECKEQYWREQQIHIAFYKAEVGSGVPMELHWMLDFKRKNRVVLPEIWDRTRQIKAGDKFIRVLSPEDTLFSLVLHARRFGKALCLKNAYDSALLLDKYVNSFDWDYCLEQSNRYELHSALFFLLDQVRLLSAKSIPVHVLNKLKVSRSKRMVARRFIRNNTFLPHIAKKSKTLYLKSHFLLYDTFLEPVRYIVDIPQEQFVKYYGLEQYSKKAEQCYRFRLFYILFTGITKLFIKDKPLESTRKMAQETAAHKDKASLVYTWGWSMYPSILDGDLVLLKKTQFNAGDVISYRNACGANIMHRVVELRGDMVVTKGDNSTGRDEPISVENVIGVSIAIQRGGKLLPVRRRCVYVRMPMFLHINIVLRRIIKKAILWVQDFNLYGKLARRIFKGCDIRVEQAIEAEDFYFVKATLNGHDAGYIKIDKKTGAILYIYVKLWFRHLGVENKLIDRHKETSELFTD